MPAGQLAYSLHGTGTGTGAAVVAGRCDEVFVVSYRPWTELLELVLQGVCGSGMTAPRPDHLRELCLIVASMIAFSRQAPEAGGVRALCPASPGGEGGDPDLSA
jgi:hypothetical protein